MALVLSGPPEKTLIVQNASGLEAEIAGDGPSEMLNADSPD
jgi:hypothetical protein